MLTGNRVRAPVRTAGLKPVSERITAKNGIKPRLPIEPAYQSFRVFVEVLIVGLSL
jgi:hypothetical protein